MAPSSPPPFDAAAAAAPAIAMPPRRGAPTPVDRLETEVRGPAHAQRMRSDTAPAPPPAPAAPTRGPADLAAQIAAAKAKVSAAAAAAKQSLPTGARGIPYATASSQPPGPGSPASAGPPSRSAPPADVAARIAAARAKVVALSGPEVPAPPSSAALPASSALQGRAAPPSDVAARIAAARAKVAVLSGNKGIAPAGAASQTPAAAPHSLTPHPTPPSASSATAARAGSSTGKNDWRTARKPKAPIHSSVRANAAPPSPPKSVFKEEEEPANPYLAIDAEAGPSAPKSRSTHAPLKFSRPGRYIAAAETLRREAAMEALKARIAERSRKAGLTESGEERVALLRKPMPPAVEWWDEPLTSSGPDDASVYGDLAAATLDKLDAYVQHPIQIPPVEKGKPPPRGVMLTTKEAKKLRRQRRAAELSDKRDRIKMGLMPPPPDKVKLSNLMRVLGNSATADPTRIEARVRRDITARYEQHVATNEARKLTPEQRAAKREHKKQEEVEARGLHEALYSIAPAMSPKQRYKISTNARQLGLTGRVIYAPGQTAVLVQGGPKLLRKFDRLMTSRIDWTDPDPGHLPGADAKPLPEGESKEADFVRNECVCVFLGAAISHTWDKFNIFHVDSIAAPAREAFAPRPELWDRVRAVVRLHDKHDDL